MSSSLFNRRGFLQRSTTALACRSALADTTTPEAVEVSTSYGRIRGVRSKGVWTFRGIPYAGAVSGANRFKAAPSLQP